MSSSLLLLTLNFEFIFMLGLFYCLLAVMGESFFWKTKMLFSNWSSAFFSVFLCFFFLFFFLLFPLLYDKRFFFFDLNFLNDNFILFTKFLMLSSAFFILILSFDYLKQEFILRSFEYFVLFSLGLLGMFFLVSCNDFLTLYITIEFQSLSLYVLASFKQNSLFSIEAGLKYFILGTFSSGLLLFGISLLYGFVGTLNFNELDMIFQNNILLRDDYIFKLGLLFFFSSLLFKISAAPYHMWTPDVYQGAPTIVTLFFSVVPKIAFLGLFVRLVILFFLPFEFFFKFIFFFCGFLSLLIGGITGLYQIKLKRLLAYSSVSNIGYILMALSCAHVEALSSALLFFSVYVFIVIGIFAVMLSLRYVGSSFKLKNIFELMSISNFSVSVSALFVLNLFSLLGLPPLAGFLTKFYLFFLSLGSEFFLFLFVSILGSILFTVVYLRLIRLTLFVKSVNIFFFNVLSLWFSRILSLTLVVNFFVFFYSNQLFSVFFAVLTNFFKVASVLSLIF